MRLSATNSLSSWLIPVPLFFEERILGFLARPADFVNLFVQPPCC